MINNLEKLKQYFDQAKLEYYLFDDVFDIDINNWIVYNDNIKKLNLSFSFEISKYYQMLNDKEKTNFINHISEKYNIEINRVDVIKCQIPNTESLLR